MPTRTETDMEALRHQVNAHEVWFHRIELAPGLVTPGIHASADALRILEAMGLPRDAKGLRVLDIGCRDGFFAFELERRGATVVGLDYAEPDVTGFRIASQALGSQVEYVVANVYDLAPERFGTYDVVLFLGVLYHLRNPLLALDCLRQVMKPGAHVFVETHILTGKGDGASDEPLWRFYPRDELVPGDFTNKWAPNMTALQRALEECQIEVLQAEPHGDRGWVRGRAVAESKLDYYRVLDSASGLFSRGC